MKKDFGIFKRSAIKNPKNNCLVAVVEISNRDAYHYSGSEREIQISV